MSSEGSLTKPITRNRIREACQVNSHMPTDLRRFLVELLVNDLNKVGARIPLKTKEGRPVNVDSLCERVFNHVPDVERACVLTTKNHDSKETHRRIVELAKLMNEKYGSSIQIRMPGSQQDLPAERICDQMYAIGDMVARRLQDDHNAVNRNLQSLMDNLEAKKRHLDDMFRSTIASVGDGSSLDLLARTASGLSTVQRAVMGNLDKTMKSTQHLLSSGMSNSIHINRALQLLYEGASMSGDEKLRVSQYMVAMETLALVQSLSPSTSRCGELSTDVLAQINKDFDVLIKASPDNEHFKKNRDEINKMFDCSASGAPGAPGAPGASSESSASSATRIVIPDLKSMNKGEILKWIEENKLMLPDVTDILTQKDTITEEDLRRQLNAKFETLESIRSGGARRRRRTRKTSKKSGGSTVSGGKKRRSRKSRKTTRKSAKKGGATTGGARRRRRRAVRKSD